MKNIKGDFKMEFSTSTLNTVIFRRINQSSDNYKYFDLIFSGVQFLQVPFSFNCEKIEEVENLNLPSFTEAINWSYKKFKITTLKGEYYILASNLNFENNNLQNYNVEQLTNEADLIINALKQGTTEEEILKKYGIK